jgi:hypothetical protein
VQILLIRARTGAAAVPVPGAAILLAFREAACRARKFLPGESGRPGNLNHSLTTFAQVSPSKSRDAGDGE